MSVSCFIGWAANQSSGAAAADITYAGIAPSTATNVGDELDWRANHVGSSVVVTSFADLERLYPASGGLHTINKATRFTSFDGLPPGNHIELVFPGSIDTGQSLAVVVAGDYAGPLFSGEVVMDSIAILNVNPGGSDVEMLSPVGRTMLMDTCQFLGQGGVELKASGTTQLAGCLFKPAASGAVGLVITSTVGVLLLENNLFTPPGGAPYIGVTVAATATVADLIRSSPSGMSTVVSGDSLFMISPSATLPGGGVKPATASGVRLISSSVFGPGSMFAPGSLTEDDIEIVASAGQGRAPNTRFLGDAFVNVSGGTLIPMSFAAVPIGNTIPVPASNGVGGVLALIGLSSHFTLDISDPAAPFLRFDGPDDNKSGVVSWSFDYIKSGAANSITGLAAIEPAAGGGYVPVIGSESTPGLAPTTIPNRRDGGAPIVMNSGDKLRIVAFSDGTSAIDISQIVLVGNLAS